MNSMILENCLPQLLDWGQYKRNFTIILTAFGTKNIQNILIATVDDWIKTPLYPSMSQVFFSMSDWVWNS